MRAGPRLSHRVLAALVVLAVGCALVFASTPAIASVLVHCCCGDHDGADACDCPDCPVLHDDREPAPTDSVRSCVQVMDALQLAPPSMTLPPTIPLPPAEVTTPPTPPAPAELSDRPLDPPPSPPPRA